MWQNGIFVVQYYLNVTQNGIFLVQYYLNSRQNWIFLVQYYLNVTQNWIFLVQYYLNLTQNGIFLVQYYLNMTQNGIFLVQRYLNASWQHLLSDSGQRTEPSLGRLLRVRHLMPGAGSDPVCRHGWGHLRWPQLSWPGNLSSTMYQTRWVELTCRSL